MSTGKLKTGVIGVGRMGERHCRVYASLNNVEFVGVSDTSPDRGKAVARIYDVEFYQDYRDLLSRVEAVSVATPTDSHLRVAGDCLRRHVHVLLEKPMASNPVEARELLHLTKRFPVLFQVGHIERFNPVFSELRSVLDELQVVAVTAKRLSPFDTSNTEVDVVYDLMVHDIDLVLALLGDDVGSVQAYGRSAMTGSVDYAVANLRYSNGPLATLMASRVTEQKVRLLEITAIGAYIEADLLNKSIYIHRRAVPEYVASTQKPLRYRQESLIERIHIPTVEPLILELQGFVSSIKEGGEPLVTAEDGLRALELAALVKSQIVPAHQENNVLVA